MDCCCHPFYSIFTSSPNVPVQHSVWERADADEPDDDVSFPSLCLLLLPTCHTCHSHTHVSSWLGQEAEVAKGLARIFAEAGEANVDIIASGTPPPPLPLLLPLIGPPWVSEQGPLKPWSWQPF